MRPVNRYPAKLPVSAMQTYKVASPRSTHTRPATCEEVGCAAYLKGWVTTVPRGSDQERSLRQFVGRHAPDGLRRDGKEISDAAAGEVRFIFAPGSPCFRASTHRKSLQRPELFLVRGGDWRANTGLIRRHTRPEHWVEDMSETLDKVARRAGQR